MSIAPMNLGRRRPSVGHIVLYLPKYALDGAMPDPIPGVVMRVGHEWKGEGIDIHVFGPNPHREDVHFDGNRINPVSWSWPDYPQYLGDDQGSRISNAVIPQSLVIRDLVEPLRKTAERICGNPFLNEEPIEMLRRIEITNNELKKRLEAKENGNSG